MTGIIVNYKINIFESPEKTSAEFADHLVSDCINIIAESGIVNIALSGGNTPKMLFDILSEDYSEKLDWSKVHLFWVDERCVPPDDSESNFGMTKEHLLNSINIPDTNVHRIYGEDDPEREVVRYSEELKNNIKLISGIPVFDLMLLGMGDDGHTASIFPNIIELWDSANICEVAVHPVSGQKRITITGKVINNSKKIVFLVTGKSKSEILSKIIKKEEGYLNYPSSLVNPVTGELHFYLDKNAAINL